MPNQLIQESSPYLLQHANNPVHWFPWGTEALDKAKSEKKLILISIGYSACHWCHVMEKESFENQQIADVMNTHFVCIKVDREERTDIDQIYMQAVQMMTGQGGWPLNCFALPDTRPVYGGTYFPPAKWKSLLLALAKRYIETPEKFEEYAANLTAGIQDNDVSISNKEFEFRETLSQSIKHIKKRMDMDNGGFKGAPKFPMPAALELLFEDAYLTKDKHINDFIHLTLHKMANSGLYDQLGGGFARYSVDAKWKVPHFEKMLYDNAQLVSLYSKAYQVDKQPRYQEVIDESLAYIKREMTNDAFGFYSAQDADSEGIEGKFFIWTSDEIKSVLKADATLFIQYFQITENGNWENKQNILYPSENNPELLKSFSLTENEMHHKITNLKHKLFVKRSQRIYPGLDDKSISSWNALMLIAYIDAYKALANEEYLDQAKSSANYLTNLINPDGKMKRIFKKNKTKIDGFLDDYAFSIKAFLSLYQITFVKSYLDTAIVLNNYVLNHFWDEKSKLFFYTSNLSKSLITRKKELTDNVIPASNSVMAHNLFDLGKLLSDDSLVEKAQSMFVQVQQQLTKGGEYYANWTRLLHKFNYASTEVVITGNEYIDLNRKLQTNYHPMAYFLGSKSKAYLPLMENRLDKTSTKIYVCKDKTCQLPTNNLDVASNLIKFSA